MRVHGAAAMLMLFVYRLAARCTCRRLARGKNRASGAILAASLLVLRHNGYGLFYLGDETARGVFSIGHWAARIRSAARTCDASLARARKRVVKLPQ